jgi:hypothetical protein
MQPSGFSLTLKNNYDYLPCGYSQEKCYVVRTYNNNNGISDFTNHQDYTVCVNSLNNANPTQPSGSGLFGGEGLSKELKYVIVILTLFIIGNPQSSFVVGCVLAMFVLILFTVLGWIPAWILIILILIAVAVTILISKSPSNSGSG